MPFSWKKKTRCTRFSRLVADHLDHLQSPKRGGSLVVETGFPTSLIDLYVRNRGRFRRFSERKPTGNDLSIPLSSSSPSDSSVDSNNSSSVGSGYRRSDEIVEEDVVVDGIIGSVTGIESAKSSKIEEETSVEMARSNRILMAALKLLFVMVLALGTKRFTLGITVSAFVLFFLELVGKPLLQRWSLITPGVDPKSMFESSFHGTKSIKSSEQSKTPVVSNEVLEIEELIEVRSEKVLDEVRCEVSMEVRDKTSRRAKMKSKMKKLVPKKLRTSRSSSMDSKGEISHCFKEEDTVELNQGLKPLVSKQEQEKIVEIEGQSSSSTLLTQTDSSNKPERELHQNSGYLILCLIVLVGLVGGRILALVLALSWCLILKMKQRRNVKFLIS